MLLKIDFKLHFCRVKRSIRALEHTMQYTTITLGSFSYQLQRDWARAGTGCSIQCTPCTCSIQAVHLWWCTMLGTTGTRLDCNNTRKLLQMLVNVYSHEHPNALFLVTSRISMSIGRVSCPLLFICPCLYKPDTTKVKLMYFEASNTCSLSLLFLYQAHQAKKGRQISIRPPVF